MNRNAIIALGAVSVMLWTFLWHSPLGAGDRFAEHAEIRARRTLDFYELPMIQAHVQRSPLTRRIILSGPADEFQRAELVRILNDIPGILEVRWDPASLPQERREQR
jgi:hypothetical protein